MSRTYGRATPITRKETRSYEYSSAANYRPNPIGVTTLAAINGRGAYGRAHDTAWDEPAWRGARGLSRNERVARARAAVRGASMRRFGRNPATGAGMSRAEQARYEGGYARTFGKRTAAKRPASRKATPKQKRALRREAARRRFAAQGLGKEQAARRAMREVPFAKSEKGKEYHGMRAFTGKAKKAAKRKQPRQYAVRTVTRKRKVEVERPVKVKRRTRVAYGGYRRAKVTDPRTGRKRMSYMYRDKKGRYRKIPAWAIAGAKSARGYKDSRYDKQRERIKRRRASAARRIERSGGPFTPNRRKKKTMKRRTKASRRAAALKGIRRRKARGGAKRTTRRTTTRRRRMSANRRTRRAAPRRRMVANRRRRVARRVTRRRRAAPAEMTTNRRRRRRRSSTKKKRTYRKNRGFTSATARKASKKRWRKTSAGRGRKLRGRALRRGYVYYKGKRPRALRGQKRVRRLPKSRVYLTNRRRRRTSKRRGYAANRRRSTRRRMKANRGRRGFFRKNQAKKLFTQAALVTTGFMAHKALTHLTCNMLVKPMLSKTSGNGGAVSQYNGGSTNGLAYIATGFGVAVLGVLLTKKVAPKYQYEIGGGMVASWLHGTVISLLDMSNSAATKNVAAYLSGYASPSRAAAIGRFGRRRRGMRGLGAAPMSSILPRYTPTDPSMPGGLQQAVAQAGMGEYFDPLQGVGEYFASGVQGIGQYEPAGPMVTQAAAGFGQVIEDGIRPDANMDDVLTLAEAQAGMGSAVGRLLGGVGRFGRRGGMRGLGEYYTAGAGGDLETVGQHSEWIPNNALWAGTKPASDSYATSELTAGILETAGGNGIFG